MGFRTINGSSVFTQYSNSKESVMLLLLLLL